MRVCNHSLIVCGFFFILLAGCGGEPKDIGPRPSSDAVLKLHKTYLYTLHKNIQSKAQEVCFDQRSGKHPTREEWKVASNQWCHLGDIDVSVTSIKGKRNAWAVDVSVNVELYPLPVRSQGKQPIGGGLTFGTCRPIKSTEKTRWYVVWDGDELKFSEPLTNGLF